MVHCRAGRTGQCCQLLIRLPAFLAALRVVLIRRYSELTLYHADVLRLELHQEALALIAGAAQSNHRTAFQDVRPKNGRRIADRRTHEGLCGAGSEIAQVCPECTGVVLHNSKDSGRPPVGGLLALAQIFDHASACRVQVVTFLHFGQHQLARLPGRCVYGHLQRRRGFVSQYAKSAGHFRVINGDHQVGSVIVGMEVCQLTSPFPVPCDTYPLSGSMI